jgi:hypothetical protein
MRRRNTEELVHGRAASVYKTLFFLYRTSAPGSPVSTTLYLASESTRSKTAVISIARKLRPRALSFIALSSDTYHPPAASVIASRPRPTYLRLAQPHGLDNITRGCSGLSAIDPGYYSAGVAVRTDLQFRRESPAFYLHGGWIRIP